MLPHAVTLRARLRVARGASRGARAGCLEGKETGAGASAGRKLDHLRRLLKTDPKLLGQRVGELIAPAGL